jgi:flavin-dependent dehydrogenase
MLEGGDCVETEVAALVTLLCCLSNVGVVLEGGERVEADLVIDACGRRSPLPSWLKAAKWQACH